MIKEGTLVKAWDEDENIFTIGGYINKINGSFYPHKVQLLSNWPHKSQYGLFANVVPIAIVPIPEGLEIGQECIFHDKDSKVTHIRRLVAFTSDGRCMDEFDSAWDKCEPIKIERKKILKEASFISKWFEDNGGVPHDYAWTVLPPPAGINTYFNFKWFEYCGKEIPEELIPLMHPAWITEI